MLESHCLSILICGVAAVELQLKQLPEINACWNSVYRRVFDCHKWESDFVINGLREIDVILSAVMLHRVKSYRKVLLRDDVALVNAFCAFLRGGLDICLAFAFLS